MDKKMTRNGILQKTTDKLAKTIGLLLLFFGITLPGIHVQANPDDDLTSPPYIGRTTNSMMVLFHLKAEDVQQFLPANVTVKSDEKAW